MNTLNICIGHQPFPQRHAHFVDFFIAPKVIAGPKRLAVVPDETYGENGHSLSEYAQLLWLYKNIDSIASGVEYINISHYRRFVSPTPVNGLKATNLPWSTTIREDELDAYAFCFNRTQTSSCFNTPVVFTDGVATQYADAHVLEDFLNFMKFLLELGVFSPMDAAKFMRYQNIIPACSVGVYRVDIFKRIYFYLEKAAEFLHSPYFIARSDYQRRSVGFLLERLHSYLILELHGQDNTVGKFGHNMMISESQLITTTKDRVS